MLYLYRNFIYFDLAIVMISLERYSLTLHLIMAYLQNTVKNPSQKMKMM